MLDEASEFDTNKPARIAAFIKDLDALIDEYHAELYLFGGVLDAIEMVKKVAQEEIDMLNEAEGDEEVTDDVTTDDVAVDDTETIDTTTTTEVNPDVKAVQDSLTQAQAAAQKLGDPKLTDQIGNTITFFTRSHVVEKPNSVAENLKESMFPMLKRILK
jgi:DNA-binding ferritin-like protein (Dps family)